MEIDYKSIFEHDNTPRIIVKRKQGDLYCVATNKKAQSFFLDYNFEQDLKLKTLVPDIHFNDSGTYSYNQDTDIKIRILSANDETYELSFIEKNHTVDADEVAIFSSIFDSSDIGILIVDESGSIKRVNRGFTRLFGWREEDILNKHFHVIVDEEDVQRSIHNHKKFIERGIRSSGEIKIVNANGSVSDTLSTLTTLTMKNGKKYQITTIIDITFRKRMEKSLREAKEQAESSNRAKSSFLANMSHELRTPLNAIIGFSEMLISQIFGPLGDKKYAEYSNDIHNSACHLLEIINEILDMSRIEAGSIKLAQNEILVSDAIDTVIRMLTPHIQEKKINLSIDFPEIVPVIRVDGRLIRQAIINILSNAIKYSGKDAKIAIRVSFKKNEDLCIIIKDNGVGIPANKLAYVMQPFGRVEDVFRKKDEVEGTGLGLPIAKGMIEIHGGHLILQSQEGVGTSVELVIPSYRVIKNTGSAAFTNFKFDPIAMNKAKDNTSIAQS